jgi:excisionase family DNA binding protein
VGEDRTEGHNSSSLTDRLTISEAAALLGVHKNTVRNRIKDGTYEAETVVTERGPTYFIKRESILDNLTTNTLSRGSQELVSPQAMEFVQELLRPFVTELGRVREQLGAERARREMAEERAAALEVELEAIKEGREDAPVSPETPDPSDDAPPVESGVPETPTERPEERSWWRRMFGG